MAHPTWRGNNPNAPTVNVCSCMPEPLNELARLVTIRAKAAGLPDFYVESIKGFGSYQDGTTASGAIGAGGGHIDLNLEKISQAQALLLEALARETGWYADIRYRRWYSPLLKRWLTGGWQKHLHMVLAQCPHRTWLAVAQYTQWRDNAADGLANTPDKDDGPRTFVGRTWAAYLAIKNSVGNVAQSVVVDAKVKGIQRALRVTVDGRWGAETDNALYRTWLVRKGGRAAFLRYNLVNRKAMQKSWGAKYVDGIWGPVTQAANVATVKVIQRSLGVTADGVWGPVTDKAYRALRAQAMKR